MAIRRGRQKWAGTHFSSRRVRQQKFPFNFKTNQKKKIAIKPSLIQCSTLCFRLMSPSSKPIGLCHKSKKSYPNGELAITIAVSVQNLDDSRRLLAFKKFLEELRQVYVHRLQTPLFVDKAISPPPGEQGGKEISPSDTKLLQCLTASHYERLTQHQTNTGPGAWSG